MGLGLRLGVLRTSETVCITVEPRSEFRDSTDVDIRGEEFVGGKVGVTSAVEARLEKKFIGARPTFPGY